MILKILMKHVGDERLAQALVHLFFQLVGVLVSGSFEVPLQGLQENNLEFPDQCHIFLKIPTTRKGLTNFTNYLMPKVWFIHTDLNHCRIQDL